MSAKTDPSCRDLEPSSNIVTRLLKVRHPRQQNHRARTPATKDPTNHARTPRPPHQRTGRIHTLDVPEIHRRHILHQRPETPLLHRGPKGDKNHPSRAYGARSQPGNPHKPTPRETAHQAISNGQQHTRKTQILLPQFSRLGPKESSQDRSHDTKTASRLQGDEPVSSSSSSREDPTGRVATSCRQKLQQHNRKLMWCCKKAHELRSRSACHHGIGASEDNESQIHQLLPHMTKPISSATKTRIRRSKVKDSALRASRREVLDARDKGVATGKAKSTV